MNSKIENLKIFSLIHYAKTQNHFNVQPETKEIKEYLSMKIINNKPPKFDNAEKILKLGSIHKKLC
jgi:hypothetical protein